MLPNYFPTDFLIAAVQTLFVGLILGAATGLAIKAGKGGSQ
jgi:hypothetical protein